jgi:hypothetical protein
MDSDRRPATAVKPEKIANSLYGKQLRQSNFLQRVRKPLNLEGPEVSAINTGKRGLTGIRPPHPSVLTSLPFTPCNGLFNRIPDKPVVPFIIEGLLGSYHGFYHDLKLIVAGFANVPVSHMKIRTLVNGGSDILVTYITS